MRAVQMSFNSRYKKMLRLLHIIALGLILSCLSGGAHANVWRQEMPQAKLIGSGELRWFGLRIYSAKLWSETLRFDPKASFALELTYQRNITRERFVDTSIDEIKRLRGDTLSPEILQRWRLHMEKAFTDVKSGDQLIGVFIPQVGTRFYSSDKLLAEIRDGDFSDAFFAIWFDPRSKDSDLRKNLMGIPP